MDNEVKKTADVELPTLLGISGSPHVWYGESTRSIMIDVIIALMPALIWGVICFGLRALSVVLLSVASWC